MGDNAIGRAIAGTNMCALLRASSSHPKVYDSLGGNCEDSTL